MNTSSESSVTAGNSNTQNVIIGGIIQLAEWANKKLPLKWHPFVFVFSVAALTIIAASLILATVSNLIIVAIIVVLFLILLVFIGCVIWVSIMSDPQAPIWEMPVLKEGIPDQSVEKLRRSLDKIVEFSVAYLKGRGIAIEAKNMPANLIYPHYGPQGKGDGAAYWLAMNNRLARAYSGVDGFHILPGTGASGSVFKSGKDGVYEGGTTLDPNFAEVHISENLEWVVSTAIKRQDQVVAVLNVDIRDIGNISFNVLNDLQEELKKSQYFKDLSDTFALLPLVMLRVKTVDSKT